MTTTDPSTSPAFTFPFPLPAGLHARPASHLRAVANRFAASISLINDRTGASGNAKSVLSQLSLDIRQGDVCHLRAEGADALAAIAALWAFVRDELPDCDEPLAPGSPAEPGKVEIPLALRKAGLERFLQGTSASAGIGMGAAVIVGGLALPPGLATAAARSVTDERRAFSDAVSAVSRATTEKASAAANHQEAEVLAAHTAIIDDPALADRVQIEIAAGKSAAQAVVAAGEYYVQVLAASDSAYLRERTSDVRDVASQLLAVLLGESAPAVVALGEPSIVIADELTPGQFLGLNKEHLRGLVLAHGGRTSHTVILARSMGIPAVIGVERATGVIGPGQPLIVDGDMGLVIPAPTEPVNRYYQAEKRRAAAVASRLGAMRDQPGRTADGRPLDVGVNVASADEVAAGMAGGAQGVGLFRTEMIFMDRESAPSEDEQFSIYRRAAEAAGDKPVVLRLLDAGGDKPVPYLRLPVENNPFLGYRAVRFYAEHAPLIRSQMRAMLRAAAYGKIWILVPMVSCLEEVRAVRAMVAEAAQELKAPIPPLGIMLEVPSVSFMMNDLCDEVDFFSIGSNDLTQYFLAADRDNPKVAPLYSWAHPSFLRLLKHLVDAAHARGKWIGLCGEMADVPAALPILVGLKFDELSVSGPRIARLKAAIASLNSEECEKSLSAMLKCATRQEVETMLSAGMSASLPMLSAELLHLNAAARNKVEAIQLLTSGLSIGGWTDQPRAVEQAVWLREQSYSTGFGHGFAVPHCKSNHLRSGAISIARLEQPVDWDSMDGKPVDVVILLAIRAGDGAEGDREHMRIFARLSRLVMREEFRNQVRAATAPNELLTLLREQLGL